MPHLGISRRKRDVGLRLRTLRSSPTSVAHARAVTARSGSSNATYSAADPATLRSGKQTVLCPHLTAVQGSSLWGPERLGPEGGGAVIGPSRAGDLHPAKALYDMANR